MLGIDLSQEFAIALNAPAAVDVSFANQDPAISLEQALATCS